MTRRKKEKDKKKEIGKKEKQSKNGKKEKMRKTK